MPRPRSLLRAYLHHQWQHRNLTPGPLARTALIFGGVLLLLFLVVYPSVALVDTTRNGQSLVLLLAMVLAGTLLVPLAGHASFLCTLAFIPDHHLDAITVKLRAALMRALRTSDNPSHRRDPAYGAAIAITFTPTRLAGAHLATLLYQMRIQTDDPYAQQRCSDGERALLCTDVLDHFSRREKAALIALLVVRATPLHITIPALSAHERLRLHIHHHTPR